MHLISLYDRSVTSDRLRVLSKCKYIKMECFACDCHMISGCTTIIVTISKWFKNNQNNSVISVTYLYNSIMQSLEINNNNNNIDQFVDTVE